MGTTPLNKGTERGSVKTHQQGKKHYDRNKKVMLKKD